MAVGKKTGGKDFVKGQSGNPAGRPPMPDYLRRASRLNKHEFLEILNKYIRKTVPELSDLLKDPSLPSLDAIVIKILFEGIKHGDEKKLAFVLDRLIGKVKEEINLSGGIAIAQDMDLSKLNTKELNSLYKLLNKCNESTQ